MTTTADLIESTRRHLMSGETRDRRNKLASSLDASTTTVPLVHDATTLGAGSVLAVDLEEMYVWEVAGSNATVERGDAGSTAAAHADGAIAFINPKFSGYSILRALNEEVGALSSPMAGLFRVGAVDLTYDAGTDTYDLTGVTDLLDILTVSSNLADGTGTWRTLGRGEWTLRRDASTSAFPSGLALEIMGYAETGQTLRVTYRRPFAAALASVSDDVETVTGIPATAHDIIPLGACIRLLAGTEVARNFLDQGDTRRADEVPAQARASQLRALAALRDERLSAERARLYQQYPVVL